MRLDVSAGTTLGPYKCERPTARERRGRTVVGRPARGALVDTEVADAEAIVVEVGLVGEEPGLLVHDLGDVTGSQPTNFGVADDLPRIVVVLHPEAVLAEILDVGRRADEHVSLAVDAAGTVHDEQQAEVVSVGEALDLSDNALVHLGVRHRDVGFAHGFLLALGASEHATLPR